MLKRQVQVVVVKSQGNRRYTGCLALPTGVRKAPVDSE